MTLEDKLKEIEANLRGYEKELLNALRKCREQRAVNAGLAYRDLYPESEKDDDAELLAILNGGGE